MYVRIFHWKSSIESSTKKDHIVKRSPLGKKTSKRKVKKRFFPKDVSNKAVTRTSPNMMNDSPKDLRSEKLNIPAQDPSPKVKAPAYQDSSYNSSLHIKQEHTKSYQRFRNPYSSCDCSQQKDDSLAPYLPLSCLSRVIAIDSRTTSSFLGDASSNSYLNSCIHLLKVAARRGVLPSLLCTSSPRTNYTSKGGDDYSTMVEVQAKNLHMHCLTDESWNSLLAPVVLSINEELDGHVKNRRTKLTEGKDDIALSTWKHFADMVDSLINLASLEHSPTFNEKRNDGITSPLNVTIITSDFIFFLENDSKSHEQGLQYFWNRVKNHFESDQLSSIKLFIIQTECRIQMSSIKYTQTFHTIQHHLEILTTSSSLPQSITIIPQMIQNHPISFTRIVRSCIRQSFPNPYISP